MDHCVCRLGSFLPVTGLSGLGISIREPRGGVFYEHCAPSSFGIYPPVHCIPLHLFRSGRRYVATEFVLGGEFWESFEHTARWRMLYLNGSVPRRSKFYAKPSHTSWKSLFLASPGVRVQMP
jgi:hypothetical protein